MKEIEKFDGGVDNLSEEFSQIKVFMLEYFNNGYMIPVEGPGPHKLTVMACRACHTIQGMGHTDNEGVPCAIGAFMDRLNELEEMYADSEV